MKTILMSIFFCLSTFALSNHDYCLQRNIFEHVVIAELDSDTSDLAGLLRISHQANLVLIPTVAKEGLYFYTLILPQEIDEKVRKAVEEIAKLPGISYFCKPNPEIPGAVTGVN